ncbi:enoyl-CoA hydratase/isomerase family protein [Mycobacteroides abscessus]|uniref:enoyl-CoA hydratase/isomerase family protein n=1 Tax=Mycobacteroides abscessus TaxID=36809 RepID=UPI0013FD02FD|nr:enoyl-CoA hydratase/isomerase family protein [Mycobacteroides abscessus]
MPVRYETDGPIARLTLARAQKLNAVGVSMYTDIVTALKEYEADDARSILVLTAEGANFCAGRDMMEQATEGVEGWMNALDRSVNHLGFPPVSKPVITAGRGYALGLGAYLMMTGDVRLASHTLRFGMRELPTGVLGPYWIGAAEHLPQGLAFRLAIGDDIPVEELRQAHLLTEVVEDGDLEEAVDRWVDKLLRLPPVHLRETKRLAATIDSFEFTDGHRDDEIATRLRLHALDDTTEAAMAFLQKRSPTYTGH